MSKKKKAQITYLVLVAVALVVVLATVLLERASHGPGAAQVIRHLSDGFFNVTVIYVGCSVLMFIQEAGNFYGIQYLFYTLVRLFSFTGKRYAEKKNYYTYCTEKEARREEEGPSPLKKAMLFVGLGCLVFSLIFMWIFYRVR